MHSLHPVLVTIWHWPWSTIAAFAAVGTTLQVARAQTRERADLLGRQTVVAVLDASNKWHKEGAEFLRSVQLLLDGRIRAAEMNSARLDRMTAAAAETDRALKTARMACNDFEILWRVAEAESQLGGFIEFMTRRPTETAEEQNARLKRTVEAGLQYLAGFGAAVEAFTNRGFDVYSPRRSLRFRRAERRKDRYIKSLTKSAES